VLVYQLDSNNRILDREARWVFGQEDVYSAVSTRTASTMRIPLSVTYDKVDKRLYVGDSWNDRILIFDADPEKLPEGGGHEAVAVLGQADFITQEPMTTQNRMDFAVTRGRGIASSMIPVGVAIDEKRRLAYVSDGGNNRVLVFNIDRQKLENGADAIAVIGQPDFVSKEVNLDAAGMNSPGHLVYDPDHDRLFVVDSLHHRVLVYDVAPERLKNGMAASLVIGQPDFTTTLAPQQLRRYTREPDDRSFPFPNGIEYDPAMQRLYVSDRINDRVMVFDAHPDRLRSYPGALRVLGQRDLSTHSPHLESDLSGQDQLYDARGMAIDSENQLLYVSDSHFARIMAFNFPSDHRSVNVPARGDMRLQTLDPYTVLDTWEAQSGYALHTDDTTMNGSITLTRTRFEVEPLSQRQSRQLISHSAAPALRLSSSALVFIDGRSNTSSTVFIANPGDITTELEFTLRDLNGRITRASKSIAAHASLTIETDKLLDVESATGALGIKSNSTVAVSAWHGTPNRHGEEIVSYLPVARDNTNQASDVLPGIMLGGGYSSEIVLLNPAGETIKGTLMAFEESGRATSVYNYEIAPGSAALWEIPPGGTVPAGRYILAQQLSGASPTLAALLRRTDDGTITATTVQPGGKLTHGRIPFNTLPDLVLHRRDINIQVSIANPGSTAATVRFLLRDLDGKIVDRYEQTILGNSQKTFSLASLFNRQQFAGTIGIASDHPVGASAMLITTNLRGEEILTHLPVLTESAAGQNIYPYLDGNGTSSGILVLASEEDAIQSRIEFYAADGERMEVIMR
jgi:sugar lactone lactonase YvrE